MITRRISHHILKLTQSNANPTFSPSSFRTIDTHDFFGTKYGIIDKSSFLKARKPTSFGGPCEPLTLKTNVQKTWCTTKSCRLVSPNLHSIIKQLLWTLWRNIRKMLSDFWGECDIKTDETEKSEKLSWLGGRRGSNHNLELEQFNVVFPAHGTLLLTLKLSVEV